MAELRWAKHFSTSQISRAVGLPEAKLAEIEDGIGEVDLVALNEICYQYGITISELIKSLIREPNLSTSYSLEPPIITKLNSLEEYRISRKYFVQRAQLTAWNIRKRQVARKKRQRLLEEVRTNRLLLSEERLRARALIDEMRSLRAF